MKNLLFILVIAAAVVIANPNKVENFTLKDYKGKSYSLKDFKESKAIVLMFVSTQCPVSNAYNDRMAEVYNAFKDKDVTFLGINSNKAEDVENIQKHAAKNGLNFTILKDEQNKIADKLSASVTPEVYVLNGDMEIVYHGRIDDSRSGKEIKSKDLENALNEIIQGKKVTNARTKAFGCTIKRIKE